MAAALEGACAQDTVNCAAPSGQVEGRPSGKSIQPRLDGAAVCVHRALQHGRGSGAFPLVLQLMLRCRWCHSGAEHAGQAIFRIV
jgi:hypothetical protein